MRQIIFILLSATQVILAQEGFMKIDMKHVEKETKDSKSNYYYPNLLSRFNKFDTTLTLEDYRMIYYGFAFNKNYSAYFRDKAKEIRDQMKIKNYSDAIKICDSVLLETPISLKTNYQKGLCLFSINKDDSLAFRYRDRYDNLMQAITSTGDGKECKTGIKVLFVGDEYEIMYNYFDIETFNGQALSSPCDILNVEPSKQFSGNAIYFDIKEMLEKEAELFRK